MKKKRLELAKRGVKLALNASENEQLLKEASERGGIVIPKKDKEKE